MLDDDNPDQMLMDHLTPHQGENEAHDMYGTIKREENHSAGVDHSQRFIYGNYNENQNSQSQISEDVMPLELIIKGKREKLTDEEIQKLIDENYHQIEEGSVIGLGKDHSVIYYNGKVYDEKKRAVYGI